MRISSGNFKALFLIGIALGIAMVVGRGLWLPWMSPDIAARFLLSDDGKSPLNDSRNAALMWGDSMYRPLSEKTNEFESINWITSNTLLDILSTNTSYPDWLLSQFEKSSSTNTKILHCYILQKNQAVAQKSNCGEVLSIRLDDLSDGESYLIDKANNLIQSTRE